MEPQLACRVCCSYRVNANREQSSDHDNTSHFQGKWSDQLQRYSIQSGPSLLNVMLDTAKHPFQPLRLIVESLMLPNLPLKYVAFAFIPTDSMNSPNDVLRTPTQANMETAATI